jgi:hypothetical protein
MIHETKPSVDLDRATFRVDGTDEEEEKKQGSKEKEKDMAP